MSIIAFCGLPGSGKSYGAVQNVVIPVLKSGRTIVTNLPLNLDAIRRDLFASFDDLPIHKIDVSTDDDTDFGVDLLALYPGAVFIFDEAAQLFPAGITQSKMPAGFKRFFTEHRHSVCPVTGFTAEIVLICQDVSQLAKPVTVLIENTYIAKKLSSVGATNRYRVDIYEGCQSITSSRGAIVRQIFGRYEKPFTDYYNSHTMNSSAIVANEQKADGRASIWKSGKVRMYLVVFIALPFLILFAVNRVLSVLKPEPEPEPPPRQTVQQPVSVPSVQAVAPVSGQYATLNTTATERDKDRTYRITDLDDADGLAEYPLPELGARVVLRHLRDIPIEQQVLGLEPSPEWRYVGYSISPAGRIMHKAQGSHGQLRNLPETDCYFYADVAQFVCVIGGYQIASWTGVRTDIGAMATHQAPRGLNSVN